MGKEFSKNNPLDKLSGITENNRMVKSVNEEHDNENKDQVKKKPGRPKTKTEDGRLGASRKAKRS